MTPKRPRLLQVCNVGQIVGGTAACAWTVTRSLPGFEHLVVFPGAITPETRRGFEPAVCQTLSRVSTPFLRQHGVDVVLLHNTSPRRVQRELDVPSVQFLHSQIDPAPADVTVACSAWLQKRAGGRAEGVLTQAVSRPIRPRSASSCSEPPRWGVPGQMDNSAARHAAHTLRVGRICTPTVAKWPLAALDLTARLAARYPCIAWEFVGCPVDQRAAYLQATGGRSVFWEASWNARSLFWSWDALLYHNPYLTESFGRTVAEALRAGCIPIVDDAGGFREQVAPETGFLCRNEQDFADALLSLKCLERRKQYSDRGRQWADRRFGLEPFSRNLVALLEEANRRFAVRWVNRQQRHEIRGESGPSVWTGFS